MRRYLLSRGINRDLKLAQKCAAESTALSTGTSARIRGKNDPKSRLAIPNLFCLIWQQFQSLKMVISPDFSDNFFSGRRRLKKRSEKTEIARPKRKHRKRKREGASVREDSQPPPPGLETCSSSRRKSSRVWGSNKTRISRNFGGG